MDWNSLLDILETKIEQSKNKFKYHDPLNPTIPRAASETRPKVNNKDT